MTHGCVLRGGLPAAVGYGSGSRPRVSFVVDPDSPTNPPVLPRMSHRSLRRLASAAVLGASFLVIGCASTGGARTASDRVDVLHPDATSRLEVRVGEVVAFDLPGHAGTGYAWRPSGECPAGLQFISGPVFTPDDPNRVGSGGLARFRYRVVTAGEATLGFDYVRAWETDARPVRRSVVDVVATGG